MAAIDLVTQDAIDAGATAEEAQAAADAKREEERWCVTTTICGSYSRGVQMQLHLRRSVVLSNADDKVISTSGADDRFEVVPQQVLVDEN